RGVRRLRASGRGRAGQGPQIRAARLRVPAGAVSAVPGRRYRGRLGRFRAAWAGSGSDRSGRQFQEGEVHGPVRGGEELEIRRYAHGEGDFWYRMGPFLASAAVRRELGAPISSD